MIHSIYRQQRQQAQYQINDAWYSFVARPTCPPSTSMTMQGGTCRQGTLASADYTPKTWTVPTIVRDLASPEQAIVRSTFEVTGSIADGFSTIQTSPTWNTAGYYKLGNLLLAQPIIDGEPSESDWQFLLHCSSEEYGTASDAETAIMDWLGDEDNFFSYTTVYYTFPCTLGSRTETASNYWPAGASYCGYCSGYGSVYTEVPSGMPLCGIILRNNGTTGTGRHFLPIDAVDRGRSYTWPRDLRPQWIGT